MKNLKVRTKLITGFLIVTVLTLVMGVVGIVSLNWLDGDYTYALEMHGKPLADVGHAIADLHAVRAELRAAMLFTGDAAKVQNQATMVQGYLDDFETRIANYDETVVSQASRDLLTQAVQTYNSAFLPAVDRVLADAEDGVAQADLVAYMVNTIKPAVDLVTDNLNQCMNNKTANLDAASVANTILSKNIFIATVALMIVAAAISMILGLYISGLISKPLAPLTEFMRQAGTVGDISFPADKLEQLRVYGQMKDEIGQTIAASAAFVDRINVVSHALGTVAEGDLTVDISPLSDKDILGLSLQKMDKNLNEMFSSINIASSQVSTGASQVADGAQALAQGATEQAASIEEFSGSIAEIAERTKANANKAEEAARLAGTIKGNAEKGSRQMDEMMAAVKDINQSSQDISRVIKVIDDIAFQTNILALNAAVEAARAGQHGKGFAVVAEEVRNLAAKSAEAAKDTESLIANSMEKSELGVKIAVETSASLSEIVSGINESNSLVSEIASSSEEQSLSISQINTGIDQVATIVQQNSATAEESAAASEQMSGQSDMLRQLIGQFKLKEESGAYYSAAKSEAPSHTAPERGGFSLPDGGARYDKY